MEVNTFVHTYSRKGKKGCAQGKNTYRPTFFVGKIMNITVNDERVIELTLEHWAKAADDEGIIHGTYTPGGLIDWWTESWCIDDDAPVSLIPHLASPTTDIQTGDEYVQLNVRHAEAAIKADFEDETKEDNRDETVQESQAEQEDKEQHANNDFDDMVKARKRRREYLAISDDDDDG